MSITLPDEEDVTQWDVARWVSAQGEHLSATQMVVLYYLSLNAFYTRDNPEGAKRGEVLYSASSYAAISVGTGLTSHTTIRRALNEMQLKGFVIRETRKEERIPSQSPMRIRVLWSEGFEDYREALRNGESELHPRFLITPKQPELAVVLPLREVDITAQGSN